MSCVPSRVTLGIDEAGRGPIIGPMVMAAVRLESRAAATLTRAGLRDSKSYGAGDDAKARRRDLAARVYDLASEVFVQVVDVCEIDRRVRRHELNVLEREVATDFIERASRVDRIVADGVVLFRPLCARYPHLEARNNGESVHAAVAAASVVAKNRRDELFKTIARRYEYQFGVVIGGGYANVRTRQFLRDYAKRFGRLPPEARRSWPYPYLADILGPDYDPFTDAPDDRAGQLGLF